MEEEQHHQNADPLHQMDVQPYTPEATKETEHQRIAGQQQQDDRREDPGKEPAEDTRPQRQARARLERCGRRRQHQTGEEHAADPDNSR